MATNSENVGDGVQSGTSLPDTCSGAPALGSELGASSESRLAEELTRLRQEQVRLLYALSHDLRSPLRIAQNFCELLQTRCAGQLDSRGAEYVDYISGATGQLAKRLDALLTLSRLNTVAAARNHVELTQVFTDVVRVELADKIRASQARVSIEALPVVMGDPSPLKQLALQLLDNAIEFHPPERAPVVTVTSAPKAFGICVSDNGIGIEPEYTGVIFDLFRRLHAQGKYSGEGAGLTIARRIAELHGGEVTCTSTPGQGSVFTVVFGAASRPTAVHSAAESVK